MPNARRRRRIRRAETYQNALTHGLFTKQATEERKRVQALLGETRKLLQDIK
jgi:hypothetical protein